ncbi:hypothetical protein MTO96_021542 [Rhipicephalus appendiculatus]
MTILLKSAALPCVRKRHVFRRCLPLVCLVPLAVLALRIFTRKPEQRQETMNARFLEEIKSLTDAPAKREIPQHPQVNATADVSPSLETVCSSLSGKKTLVECPPHIACFMPPSYRRYVVLDRDVTSGSSRLTLKRTEAPVPGESATVTVDISRVTYDTIRIRIWDRTRREFVPPVPAIEEEFEDASKASACTARLSTDNVLFVVVKDTGKVLSEFDLPRLYYTERDKHITLRPRARFAYGIRRTPSLRPFLDIGAESARHLFYRGQGRLVKELVTSPRGTLTFRVHGGHLDFFLFCGPTPQSVLEQYQGLVGRPSMPSVYTLQNPMPSAGPVKLANVVTSAHLARAVNRLGLYKIQRNFTVNITHEVVIQDSTGKRPYQCYDKHNKLVYFVDFTHPMAQQHWYAMLQISNLSEVLNTTVDYLLLGKPRCKISGPATPDYPPAPAQGATSAGEIRGDARLHLSTFVDLRNAYPYMLAEMTHRCETLTTSQRPKLLSDATFAGQGHWSGYWRARAPRTWQELGDTLAEMLTFGMLGVQMYGVGACNLANVESDAEAELCLRWFSLSVFFPVHQTLGNVRQGMQRFPAFSYATFSYSWRIG